MSAIDTICNVAGHLSLLKSRGVTHVGRYYGSRQSKRLTPQEALAISNAGLQIFVVFENGANPDLNNDQGVHDGQIALGQAQAVRQTPGSAIYFALEGLPSGYGPQDLDGAKAYMAGVASVIGDAYKPGVYGDGVICAGLLDAGLVAYTWLSASRSFPGTRAFADSNRWSIKQDGAVDQDWGGLPVDTNQIQSDIGAFGVAPAGGDIALAAPLAGDGGAAPDLAAVGLLGAPAAGAAYTVRTNHRYRATVSLSLLEAWAPNGEVAREVEGYGFKDAVSIGAGTSRTAEATWPGPDQTAAIDPRLSNIQDLGIPAPAG